MEKENKLWNLIKKRKMVNKPKKYIDKFEDKASNEVFVWTTLLLPNGKIIVGQSLGHWTIFNKHGIEISNGQVSTHSNIDTTTLLPNGDIMFVQCSSYWTIVNQDGKELSKGTTTLTNCGVLFSQPGDKWTIISQEAKELENG